MGSRPNCDADARLVAVISEILTAFVTPHCPQSLKLVIFKYHVFFRSFIVMVTGSDKCLCQLH